MDLVIYFFICLLIYISIKKIRLQIFQMVSNNSFNSKIKRMPLIKKINFYVIELQNTMIKTKFFLNIYIIIILSIIIFFITFYISYNYLDLMFTSILLSTFSFFLPSYIIRNLYYKYKEEIISNFPIYCISLKNYTSSSNDIVFAIKKAEARYPLDVYMQKFNISVENGISVYDSFENLKKSINIKTINGFITLLQYANLNGGDFNQILDKYSKILLKINLKREKEKDEIFSSKIILIILFLIDLYILNSFVFSNYEYKKIITSNLIGQLIININIISQIIIIFMISRRNKMEE